MDHFSHSWLPYIYQYGLGAVIFCVGLLITLKSGSLDLRRKQHRRWLIILLIGFVWFLTLHGSLTLAALGYERIAFGGGATVIVLAIALAVFVDRRLLRRS